jgi:hypothetical protein
MAIKFSDDDAFVDHPYAELSKEFQDNWPTAYRTIKLIPMMYNRLTLIEGYSHKAAMNKILEDHAHLPGFSERNIRRNLPEDNPIVPRRIRTACPKTSITKTNDEREFSHNEPEGRRSEPQEGQGRSKNADVEYEEEGAQIPTISEGNRCPRRPEQRAKIKGLEEQLDYLEARDQARQEDQEFNRESFAYNNESKNYRPLDFEFCLKLRDVRKYAASRFKEAGDNGDVWFNGTIDAETGLVVCTYLGRIKERSKSIASDSQEAGTHEAGNGQDV